MIKTTITDNIVTFDIDVNNRPMNVINNEFMDEMDKVIKEYFTGENSYQGFIFTSKRKEFVAGADLAMVQGIKTAEESLKFTNKLHAALRTIETCGKPVVAAINGTALGGGLEITLACHHRICLDHDKIKLGLPEVTIGLLPGGGGTQRLPRIIGFEKAIPLMTQGTHLSPAKALETGIIHELASNEEELINKAKHFIKLNPEITQPWDEKKFKIPGGPVQAPRGYQFFPAASAMLMQKTWGNYPAPEAILKCVYEGLQVPIDHGLKIEQNYFATLVMDSVAHHMIRSLFFSINECKKGAARPSVEPTDVKKVGILGAGMMGAGIAYVSAKAGIQVELKDIDQSVADIGKSYSEKIIDKAIQRGRSTEEKKNNLLALINATTSVDTMNDCDLIIEAVIEDRNIKKTVTEETEAVITENCIFASNTSTLPITGLAENSKRPENFIGLHFFSPVDKMPLVEIIVGEKTSDKALALCLDYVKKIGKTPIVVNDSRGFYTSRVFTSYITEGINALVEGIPAQIIENAGKGAGMPVGPLAVADEVSLDLIYHIMKQTVADVGEDKVDQATLELTNKFVKELGRLGRKAGKGFYEYPENGKKYLSPELPKLYPTTEDDYEFDVLQMRFLTRQALETVRCLEEGVLRSAKEADVGSILGWGFPAYTGGTLSYIDQRGLDNFINDCEVFTEVYGDRFAVPKILLDMQKENKGFYA
jgi:3-hydroxyacyl-CoA dehydrogenase/enoyl-CoA hydratase/3-hydroxybutyryl-CoA epimerase